MYCEWKKGKREKKLKEVKDKRGNLNQESFCLGLAPPSRGCIAAVFFLKAKHANQPITAMM